jgi:hypothetical protein
MEIKAITVTENTSPELYYRTQILQNLAGNARKKLARPIRIDLRPSVNREAVVSRLFANKLSQGINFAVT